MAFWNSTDVPQPPINSSKVSIDLLTKDVSLTKIYLIFEKASSTLQNLKQLHLEAALLSRTIYKINLKFHTDKGLQALRKINRGLRQYLSMDMISIFSTFSDMLPKPDKSMRVLTTGKAVYLPTRQMLEWVLVRTQGFARLFCHIASCCETASCFSIDRIRRGHMINISVVLMGIVGRIWSYAKYLIVEACEWYAELKPYLNVFNAYGVSWTPQNYIFPEDLKHWLDVPHITNNQKKPILEETEIHKVFEMVGFSADTKLSNQTWLNTSTKEDILDKEIDLGEPISREEISYLKRPANSQELLRKLKKKQKVINNVNVNRELMSVTTANNVPLMQKKRKKMKLSNTKLRNQTGLNMSTKADILDKEIDLGEPESQEEISYLKHSAGSQELQRKLKKRKVIDSVNVNRELMNLTTTDNVLLMHKKKKKMKAINMKLSNQTWLNVSTKVDILDKKIDLGGPKSQEEISYLKRSASSQELQRKLRKKQKVIDNVNVNKELMNVTTADNVPLMYKKKVKEIQSKEPSRETNVSVPIIKIKKKKKSKKTATDKLKQKHRNLNRKKKKINWLAVQTQ